MVAFTLGVLVGGLFGWVLGVDSGWCAGFNQAMRQTIFTYSVNWRPTSISQIVGADYPKYKRRPAELNDLDRRKT